MKDSEIIVDNRIKFKNEKKKSFIALVLEHPIVSTIVGGLLLALIVASAYWKNIESTIDNISKSDETVRVPEVKRISNE
jgi:hypothetical protein